MAYTRMNLKGLQSSNAVDSQRATSFVGAFVTPSQKRRLAGTALAENKSISAVLRELIETLTVGRNSEALRKG